MIAFGPIPSRRLGLSLGINNINSQKACSYNCLYCQIGITHSQTVKRQVFYQPEFVFENVKQHLEKLDSQHKPDFLTFVSNGEPTLDINLSKEIRLLKQFEIPIAVITNSSLINKAEVKETLALADWVSVKVDSIEDDIWKRINRPEKSLQLNIILEGIKEFAAQYKGKLHTETMLIDGINDSMLQIEETAKFISQINPETAYLSIPTRPPAVKEIKATNIDNITRAWQIFNNNSINSELLTGFEGTNTGFTGNAFEDILNITTVHPLREDTLELLLKKDNSDISIVHSLIHQKLIQTTVYNNKTYYLRKYNF